MKTIPNPGLRQTTTTQGGRHYHLTAQAVNVITGRHLLAQGFDGTIWLGVSKPTGRQRKTFHAIFYRQPDGTFQLIVKL